jgi:F-type H+-transporting ATPase subunit alpha
MKKVAGTLKLDQAQYRELEAFAKFGSDLDAATMNVINKGRRNVEILKQAVNSPMSVEKQVAIIYIGTKGLLNDISVEKIKPFENAFIEFMQNKHQDVLAALREGSWSKKEIEKIESAAKEIIPAYTD